MMLNQQSLQQLRKKYLHALLKQIHPDFFISNPVAKETNGKAVQDLNRLFSSTPDHPLDPSKVVANSAQHVEIKLFTRDGTHVDHILFQESRQSNPFRRQRLRPEVQDTTAIRSLMQLCYKVGVQVCQHDWDTIVKSSSPATALPWKPRRVAKTTIFGDEFGKELRRQVGSLDMQSVRDYARKLSTYIDPFSIDHSVK